MRQLDLPFTKRGRLQQRRIHGVNRRAFKCWHKDTPGLSMILHATDPATAKSEFLAEHRKTNGAAKFTDIRLSRSPEHDSTKEP